MNQILALSITWGVNMPLKKSTKLLFIEFDFEN